MDLSIYSHRRVFRQPYTGATAAVGISSVLWALMAGPLYFWRKGAMIEAALLAAAGASLWFFDAGSALISLAALRAITTAIWAGSVVLAPVLLELSYRRRGWVEITEPAPYDMQDEGHQQRG